MPTTIDFQNKCFELVNALPRTHATHCFRSAIYHLERSEAIREIDPAMAIFRAITAEEEAASGVIRGLIELGYPNAEHLNPHDHLHKHALFPFLEVLELFFGQTLASHFKKYNLHIKEEDGVTRLTLAINVTFNGIEQLAYPIPPLNFGMRYLNSDTPIDYSHQINQLIQARGKITIKAFLKEEANLRNKILYANPDGYPVIESIDASFAYKRRVRVFAMLNLFLLIAPYKEHQTFVSQSIGAFVILLKQLKRSSSNPKITAQPAKHP